MYSLTPLPEQSSESLVSGDEQSVLRVRLPSDNNAQRSGSETVDALGSQAAARTKLLAARNTRPQPARDEKIIVAWNALAIDALVRSGKILGDSASIELGKQAAARLWTLAYDPQTRELKHEIFRGQAQTPGYLDDYALLGIAFLSLHAATADTRMARQGSGARRRYARAILAGWYPGHYGSRRRPVDTAHGRWGQHHSLRHLRSVGAAGALVRDHRQEGSTRSRPFRSCRM